MIIIEKDYDSLPQPELSVRARKKLNRLFRETVGSSKIPHPDVDNYYERARSKVMRKFKLIIFKIKKRYK